MDFVIRRDSKLYNLFFYASLCHVCKQSGGNIALKQCSGCRMIVYCSQEHQKEHWPEHKDLCIAIQHVRELFGRELFAYHRTPVLMQILMTEVKEKLERTLHIDEAEMFAYAKMCLVCYKTSAELENCPFCMTVWYCAQHKNNHDSSTCKHLKLCLDASMSLLREKARPILTTAYMKVSSYEKKFSNMKEFINIYGDIKEIQSETSPHLLEIKHSVRLTNPLSILYGLRMLEYITYEKNKTELVFHIIAAGDFEFRSMTEWEIFLHIFPDLLHLQLVLIGEKGKTKFMEKRKICDICVQKRKSFLVEWQNVSYPYYVRMCPTFKQPDLVIRFYSDYNDNFCKLSQNMLKLSIKCIAELNCPLLLYHSQEKNVADMIINNKLGGTIEFCTYKNPFACLFPNRMYTDTLGYFVYYENAYLSVYKTLCP